MSPIIYGGSLGGGSPAVITRGNYGYAPVTILANGAGNLHFGALAAGGTPLLDLTNPAKPLIVTAGVYAMTGLFSLDDNMIAGEYFNVELGADVDSATNAALVDDQVEATATLPEPELRLSLTWYLPAGAALQVAVGNNSMSPHDYWVSPFYLQRLS